MDLHESPVTSCLYFADCPHDLIPAFYSVGCRQKKTGYSEKVSHLCVIDTVSDLAAAIIISYQKFIVRPLLREPRP